MPYAEPQINFPPRPAAPAGVATKKPPKVSTLPFEQYLRNWMLHIKQEQDRLRKLCEMSVTLHRRFRGLTLSDLCGRYGIRRNTDGKWLDYDADLDGEIHPINIVQPAIRANTNACLQSNPATEVSSSNASAKNKQIAMRWQRVSDYLERTGWDETGRGIIFDAIQKDGTILIESYLEECDSQSVPGVNEQKMGLAVYQCPWCSSQGMTQTDGEQEGMIEIPCPECGQPAQAVVKTISGFDLAEQEVPTYNVKSRVIPFFNFTIDRQGAKIAGIQGAKWLQIQDLDDRAVLETKYPHHSFAGGPSEWSYQIQCSYALANSDWRFLNYAPNHNNTSQDFDRFEKKRIYLHEEAYSNYRAPADYEFINGQGKKVFQITRGQTIAEAQKAMYGDNPKGFCFLWCDERLLDVVSPEAEEINFRERFSDVHWLRDSSSYLSSPNYSIVIIQDDITLLNTMNHNIIARNAVVPVYFDSLVFDDADFSKEYVGSKNAHLLPDRDMSKAAMQLPIPTPSPHLSNQLQFLWEIKDTITQVQPAMRGEQQKGETYGAQRQQLEQSYGLLTSVLKSFAACLGTSFKHKAKLVSKKWTLEQFQKTASMFGEIWTDEDVEEMCEIDFDEDLIVSYRSGSEMPQSNLDREIKFFQGLAQLMPFVEAGMVSPDKLNKILQKIDEYSEFDFDLTGLEVNELIAQKRFIELAQICSSQGDVTFEHIDAAKQTVVAIDEEGLPITQLDLITEQIFYSSKIRFSQYEDLEQQKAFFIEQLRAETGKTQPGYLLIEMLTVVIGLIDQALQAIQMEQIMNDPAVQAELAAASDAKATEESDKAREDENAKTERDDSAAESEKQFARGLITQGAQNEHDLEKTALQGKIQKENKPKPTAAKKK